MEWMVGDYMLRRWDWDPKMTSALLRGEVSEMATLRG